MIKKNKQIIFVFLILCFLFILLKSCNLIEGFGLKKHITIGDFVGHEPIQKQNAVVKVLTDPYPNNIKRCKESKDQTKCKDSLLKYVKDAKLTCSAFLHKNKNLEKKCHDLLYEPIF
jgi:predicted small secreted protein